MRSCTATYLSGSVALTAAHCIKPGSSHISIRDYFTGIESTHKVASAFGNSDVALVRFPPRTYQGARTFQLSFLNPGNARMRILSYGMPFDEAGRPVFRSGFPTTRAVTSTSIEVMGKPGPTLGDSGCPIINENDEAIVAVQSSSFHEPAVAPDGTRITQAMIEVGETYSFNSRVGSNDDFKDKIGFLRFYLRALNAGFDIPKVNCRCETIYDDGRRRDFVSPMIKALSDRPLCTVYEYRIKDGMQANCREVE